MTYNVFGGTLNPTLLLLLLRPNFGLIWQFAIQLMDLVSSLLMLMVVE